MLTKNHLNFYDNIHIIIVKVIVRMIYMMYPFATLADNTVITHSHLLDYNGEKSVEIHFERPIDGGFDMARCLLPSYEWIMRDGYSDSEIATFERMCADGAHIFYKYAELGGAEVAKAV